MNRLRPFQLFCCLLMTCVVLKAQQPLSFYFPDKSFINTSDPNNRNVNHPDGSNMQDLKRATAFIAGSADEFCSCTLMNNVRQDGSILVSTSAHCFPDRDSGSEIGVVLTFNYEMSDALKRGTDVDDVVITNAYNVSGTLLYKDEISDIALLKLRVEGIENWPENVYAAGWDLSIKNTLSSNISHPQGDHKKIFINPENQAFKWKDLEGFQGYAFEMNGRWNNRSTHLEGGASGSGFFNSNQALIGIYSGFHPSSDANYSSALSNAWYNADGAQDLRNWLDPDQTWITQIPGGYLTDMIPVQSDFTLDIGGGETYSSKGINPSDPSRLEEGVHHLRPAIIFNDLASSASWESILGIQMPAPHASDVVLTVHEIIWDEEIAQYREQLLYGAFTNNTISPNVPVSAGFRGAGWDCNDLPVGFPPCERNTGFWLIDRPVDWSTTIKPVFARALSLQSSHEEGVQSLWDVTIPVVIRLTNVGSESVEVRAVSYPAEVPRNARQLFKPKELAQQFRSYKYPSSRGANAGPIFINRLSAQQNGQQLQEIKSGNNGGYLNLGNPNFKIGPVKVDPTAGDLELTFDIVNQIFPYNYKVWIDYFNSDDLEGRWEIDPEDPSHSYTYNFVNDPVAHPMEEIAAGFASDGTLLVNRPLPRAREIKLNPGEKRLTRMRVAVSNELITQDGDYGIGEVEDYLIELVAPTCEELRPVEYEDFAEAVLPYCGEGGYRESKEPLANVYQEETPGGLQFLTGKRSNVRFASVKATGSWYTSGANAIIDNRVDPVPNPADPDFDQSLMAISTNAQEADPDELVDQELRMDVYYPLPKEGITLDELSALPLIIYHFGGAFMWNTRQSKLTEKTCQWLASKGFVVAAIDYRVGLYGYEEKVGLRTMLRAWQDSRAATKWWRMPENEHEVNDDFEELWKVDQSKVYVLGHSAGGITSQSNLFLTELKYENERESGNFLEATSGGYGYGVVDDSGNPHYRTFGLEDYEPIPCLNIQGHNTCDVLSKATDGSYGSYQGSDGELAALISQRLNTYASMDGRADKAASFAGALAKTDWMLTPPFRYAAEIHHHEDAVVPWGYDYPFNGGNLPWGSIISVFPNFSISRIYGGGAMKEAWDNALLPTGGTFELLTLDGADEGGMNGQASYHVPEYKFGSNYDDYLNGADPEIENKIMYYVDAFFTKDWTASGTSSRFTHASREEEVLAVEPEIATEPVFKVFPNPVDDLLNVIVNIGQPGPLKVELMDLQGRLVYDREKMVTNEGTNWIRLANLNVPSGLYLLRLRSAKQVWTERIVMK